MATYEFKIKVDAPDPVKAVELGNLMQFAVKNVDINDLVKLSST